MPKEKEATVFPVGSRVAHVYWPNLGGTVTGEPLPMQRDVTWDDCGSWCGSGHLLHVSELVPA